MRLYRHPDHPRPAEHPPAHTAKGCEPVLRYTEAMDNVSKIEGRIPNEAKLVPQRFRHIARASRRRVQARQLHAAHDCEGAAGRVAGTQGAGLQRGQDPWSTSLDHHMWRLTYKGATFSHPNKSKRWVAARYFGEFNTSRRDRWVFGDRASGRYLTKFAWTPIVRHRMVPGTASVDDPALDDFWAIRRRRRRPPLATSALRLLRMQDGRCPLCGAFLLHADHEPQHPDEWEQWFKAVRSALRKQAVITETVHGTPDEPAVPRLVHAHCHRRRTLGVGGNPALLSACELAGLA